MSSDDNEYIPDNGADEIIEEAVAKAIERFKHEHPETYKVLVRRIENPVALVVETLKRDATYKQLVTETDEAVDLARITVGIAEVALTVAEKFLIAL